MCKRFLTCTASLWLTFCSRRPLMLKLHICPWSNLTSTKPSLETMISSGDRQPLGGSKDRSKSPFKEWTKQAPSGQNKINMMDNKFTDFLFAIPLPVMNWNNFSWSNWISVNWKDFWTIDRPHNKLLLASWLISLICLPLDPLKTSPSSAKTATHMTSESWPVRVALGVGCSKPKKQNLYWMD